ncbi:colicin D domain-containing protein [Nocardia sp. NPDC088792]|uniref:colicin D domain-containing protein n=1 Tax=Nocardia sp. NPDC088792 TaxID=3364332 RepID=UPI0038028D29
MVAVDPQAYADTAEQLSKLGDDIDTAATTLTTSLAGTGSMAGTTDHAKQWAAAYDSKAANATDNTRKLAQTLRYYAGLVALAGHNHALANYQADTNTAKGPAPVKPPTPESPVPFCWVGAPAAGGPGRGLETDIPDLLEKIGIPVPDGDTDKLDKAAQAWHAFAQSPAIAESQLTIGAAASLINGMDSPEVPDILGHLTTLSSAARSIELAATTLEADCHNHRSRLTDLRNKIKHFIDDLAEMIAVSIAVSIVATFITAGIGLIVDAAAAAKAAKNITDTAALIKDAIETSKLSETLTTAAEETDALATTNSDLDKLAQLPAKVIDEESAEATEASTIRLGSDVKTVDEQPLSIDGKQIEAKFKHAQDFGVTEGRGREGFDQLTDAVGEQVENPNTLHIAGTYRGNPAILNYNPDSGLVVVQSPSGEFVSGWKLSPAQAKYVLEQGKLGGG